MKKIHRAMLYFGALFRNTRSASIPTLLLCALLLEKEPEGLTTLYLCRRLAQFRLKRPRNIIDKAASAGLTYHTAHENCKMWHLTERGVKVINDVLRAAYPENNAPFGV